MLDINPEKGTKRSEGNSSSAIARGIIKLVRACRSYTEDLQKQASENEDDPEEDTPQSGSNSDASDNDSQSHDSDNS